MDKTTENHHRIITLYKGLLKSLKTIPVKRIMLADKEPGYRKISFDRANERGEVLEILIKSEIEENLFQLLDKTYPRQIDSVYVSRIISGGIQKWLYETEDPDDSFTLAKASEDFIRQIVDAIRPFHLIVPIEGLKLESSEGVKLGNCTLYKNTEYSEFQELAKIHKHRLHKIDTQVSWLDQLQAYMTYKIEAHEKRAVQEAIEEANLSISILQLFIGSHYFGRSGMGYIRRDVGVSGLVFKNERTRVFSYTDPSIDSKESTSKLHEEYLPSWPYELKGKWASELQELGLARINNSIQARGTDASDSVSTRIYRAIKWFSNATVASDSANSYMMFAIALESLLSTGNVPTSKYAKQVGALITSISGEKLLEPIPTYLHQKFAMELRSSQNSDDRFNIIASRTEELFQYRNKIVHGAVADEDVDRAFLLDFESIVRNSIISFIRHDWNTINEFNIWVEDKVSYRFDSN